MKQCVHLTGGMVRDDEHYLHYGVYLPSGFFQAHYQ